MIVRCTLECQNCHEELASVLTFQSTIPRRFLLLEVRENGAVRDQAGRWYCGPGCRLAFRLTHNMHRKDLPDV